MRDRCSTDTRPLIDPHQYEPLNDNTMSTLLDTFLQDKPLTIDGCTFYLLNGKLACRRARNRKKPRKDRAGKLIIRRTPAQLAVNERFRGMRRFARIGKRVRERIGAWKIAAAGTGRMGGVRSRWTRRWGGICTSTC